MSQQPQEQVTAMNEYDPIHGTAESVSVHYSTSSIEDQAVPPAGPVPEDGCEVRNGTDKDTVAVWLGRGGAKILKYYTGAALKWFVVEDSRHGCSHQTGVEHPTLYTEIQSRH